MTAIVTYDSKVAARTRAAAQILKTQKFLDAYMNKGGLKEDLEKIRDHGHAAEILSQAQSTAKSKGGAATLTVLESFTLLQKEYGSIMAVVQAARNDLSDADASHEVIKAMDRILVNEAEVLLRTVVNPDGTTRKKAVKSTSQEAIRAEIARDAGALLELSSAHSALDKRKVTKTRLEKLRDDAKALSGKLAERTAIKGSQKEVTKSMREAVAKQKKVWAACSRILWLVAQDEPAVEQLLKAASSRRSPSGGSSA